MPSSVDLTSRRYGRLIVVALSGHVMAGREKKRTWLCRCDCGTEVVLRQHYLTSGDTKSCGCYRRECTGASRRTHGESGQNDKTGVYGIWVKMRDRCANQHCPEYRYYGGRGITVCDRWQTFINFRDDMGPRPLGYSIERRDVNGNYEPNNCFWLPRAKQSRNRRDTARVTHNGQIVGLPDLCEDLGLNIRSIHTAVWRNKITHQEAFERQLARKVA